MSAKKLNESFYQTILNRYEKCNSITITDFIKKSACKKGTSYVSEVNRVIISGYKNNTTYTTTVILKELPYSEQSTLYRSHLAMENEVQAYTEIVPSLQKHAVGQLPLANCIYAKEDVIILEDLCLDGYKPNDITRQGMTLEQCESVLEALAKLHAASFVMKQKNPGQFAKISQLTKEILYHENESVLLDHQTSFLSTVLNTFNAYPRSPENEKAIEVISNLKENSKSKIKELLTNPGKHSVICHGDCWAGNILFKGEKEVKLIDLQLMPCSSVARDLTYFLYLNLPPLIRTRNTENLLNKYLQALHENTKAKGVVLDDVLTKEWLDTEMEAFSEYGLVYGMWVLPVFFKTGDDFEISKRSLENAAKAFSTECEKRLRDMVLEYIKTYHK